MLPYSLSHKPRLVVIHPEAFLLKDRCSVQCETLYSSLEVFPAGEREVVGVARIVGAHTFGQCVQPAVHAVKRYVRQHGR